METSILGLAMTLFSDETFPLTCYLERKLTMYRMQCVWKASTPLHFFHILLCHSLIPNCIEFSHRVFCKFLENIKLRHHNYIDELYVDQYTPWALVLIHKPQHEFKLTLVFPHFWFNLYFWFFPPLQLSQSRFSNLLISLNKICAVIFC